jgi:hypothetical protein
MVRLPGFNQVIELAGLIFILKNNSKRRRFS